MTTEARLAFIVFFFAVWCFLGLMTWAAAAVIARGRGALAALPLSLAAACSGGVAVPLFAARDAVGFFLSLGTATLGGMAGSIAGIALARRLGTDRLPADMTRPAGLHARTIQRESDAETD